MGRNNRSGLGLSVAAAILIAVLMPAAASAHVERASYWPDPAPDCSVQPCTGGQVPSAKTLASALDNSATKVVCQADSLARVQQSIANAQTNGYTLRSTQPKVKITAAEGTALLALNKKLVKRCDYSAIQAAVNDSGNNGRVVIMPGTTQSPHRAPSRRRTRPAPSTGSRTTRARPAPSPTSGSSTARTTRT